MLPRTLPAAILCALLSAGARADEVKVIQRAADPFGAPRPEPNQKHVPLRTTIYVELGMGEKDSKDAVLPESVAIEIQPAGGKPVAVLNKNRRFAEGFSGRFLPGRGGTAKSTLAVYVEPEQPLHPETTYTIRVAARSGDAASLPEKAGAWTFTTEGEPKPRPIEFRLNLRDAPARWEGGFFTGFCNVSFCTSKPQRIPTYDLMAAVRKDAPKAWSLQRDFWLTGMEHQPELLARNLPNA